MVQINFPTTEDLLYVRWEERKWKLKSVFNNIHNNLPASFFPLRSFNISQTIHLIVYLCKTIKNYDFINDRLW